MFFCLVFFYCFAVSCSDVNQRWPFESKCKQPVSQAVARRELSQTAKQCPICNLPLLNFFVDNQLEPTVGIVRRTRKPFFKNPLLDQTAGLNAPRYPVKLCRGVLIPGHFIISLILARICTSPRPHSLTIKQLRAGTLAKSSCAVRGRARTPAYAITGGVRARRSLTQEKPHTNPPPIPQPPLPSSESTQRNGAPRREHLSMQECARAAKMLLRATPCKKKEKHTGGEKMAFLHAQILWYLRYIVSARLQRRIDPLPGGRGRRG